LTSPKLLLAGLDQHKDTVEFLHINSINSRSDWRSAHDDRFRGDDDSIIDDYDPTDEEMAAEHEERQMTACKELKEEFIQPIDLHDFKVLNVVSVHITDLLGAMNKEDASDYIPLSTVLPPAIKVLSLRYSNYFSDWDPQLEFIYENDLSEAGSEGAPWTVDNWFTSQHEAWYEIYYAHLTELLLLKTEKFPELKEMMLCLDKGWPKPGQDIMELANDVGVIVAVINLEEECPKYW
jgi:hypothetical protein